MQATLTRISSNQVQTEGLFVYGDYSCKTLELPWRDNQRKISRIPAGTYEAIRHVSPTFGKCFQVLHVPNRSHILIHKGNFHRNTLGCILVGREFKDIDGDGNLDVTSSGLVMDELLEILPNEFELIIRDRDLK